MRLALTCAVTWTLATAALAAEAPAGGRQPDGPEWPMYRGNPGFTGVSPDDSVKPPFKLLWSYRTDGDVSGDAGVGLIVGGGKVFANVHNTNSLLALDAATGRLAWEYTHPDVTYTKAPAYVDGRVLVWRLRWGRSALVALDAATGKPLWEKKLNAKGTAPGPDGPAVLDGRVYLADGTETGPGIVALDAKSGEPVWRAPLGAEDGAAALSPSAAGKLVFTGVRDTFQPSRETKGATVALDAATGREVWRVRGVYPFKSPASDGRVVAVGMLYSPDRKYYVLDAATGRTLWTAPEGTGHQSAAITDELILAKPHGCGFTAFERGTGKKLWSFDGKGGTGCSAPVVAGGHAYMGTGCPTGNDSESPGAWALTDAPRTRNVGWTLHAVDLKTGKGVWSFGTGDNVCGDPAVAYGRLYAWSRDGRVYCFAPVKPGEEAVPDARDKSPNAPAEEVKKCLSAPLDPPRPGRDWPMCGGSPERAGLEGIALNPPLAPAWKFDAGGRVLTAPAIRDGRVFFGSDSGKIFALDAAGGAKAWEFATGAQVRCSPAVAGGVVYCGSDDGSFYALDAASGARKWAFECGGPVQASPAVVGGVVVFGANDHHTYALDRLTGKKLWSFRSSYFSHQAAPVVHGDKVFLAPWVDWVYALEASTGRELWKSYVPITVEALAWRQDKLYVRTPYYVMEYDPADGRRLRMGDAPCGYGGMGFAAGGLLLLSGIQGQYGASGALGLELGGPGKEPRNKVPSLENVLQFSARGMKGGLGSMGAPLGLGERACFATVAGEAVVTGLDGTRQWSAKLEGACHAPPVAADGLLVVGCDDGKLYGFRGK